MTARTRTDLPIDDLRNDLTGGVILPGDDGYDEARTPFYGGFDKHPAIVVKVADTEDVVRVIALARDTDLELTIRSGGHSVPGYSVSDGGIQLDLGELRTLEIDREGRTAWAGTGSTTGEYTAAAAELGLATGFGDTGSVGIGGITLGGGVGLLVRRYGLTIDHLLAAEIVTADGSVFLVDEDHEPDLFWAIRGGGGNFGVATRFRFRLHEVPRILGGMLFLPATPEVVASFLAEADAAPDEVSTIANVMTAPPMPFIPEEAHGRPLIMAMIAYAGDPEAGERALAPFRTLATPLADLVRPMSYPELFLEPEGEEEYHPLAASYTGFADAIGAEVAAEIIEHLEEPVGMMRVAQLRRLGGAMARVPNDATAFAHRDQPIMVNVGNLFLDAAERPASQAWVDGTVDVIGRSAAGYSNFLGDDGPERVRAAYPGATWDRLRSIKARYDPTNLFRMNQNIPPAEG
jgi:FAD/FMN-containing dehydrogenase